MCHSLGDLQGLLSHYAFVYMKHAVSTSMYLVAFVYMKHAVSTSMYLVAFVYMKHAFRN